MDASDPQSPFGPGYPARNACVELPRLTPGALVTTE
jgi:hypothetical protein